MGRRRAVDRDALLDAAEAVVARVGAAHLTLDAVASEAGISKSSVLYDCGSKKGLIQAMVARRVETFYARQNDLADALGGANAMIRARLQVSSQEPDASEVDASQAICAAFSENPEVRAPLSRHTAETLEAIRRDSPTPDGATLAFLALEGLMVLERFEIHHFDAAERARLIGLIGWLAEQSPKINQEPDTQPVSRPAPGPDRAPETTLGASRPQAARRPDARQARKRAVPPANATGATKCES